MTGSSPLAVRRTDDAPPPGAAAHETVLDVAPHAIDEMGHVNNVVYVQWVQDVATAHWRARAPADAQATVAWVALRHEIDYHHPAVLGDRLTVRTWIGQADGLTFERHTAIVRAADGRLLARARTLWCPVDARTGRPKRVSPALRALFSVRGG